MTTKAVRLAAGQTTAMVHPAGGRVTSLVTAGHELLVQHGADVFHWGSFPLAPWVGRVRHGRFDFEGTVVHLPLNARPHALHGLVTERSWSVVRSDERSVSLAVELGPQVSRADPWPWSCRVLQTISLSERSMEFELAVEAADAMPADIGWHPWFAREIETEGGTVTAELCVAGGRVYLNAPDGIPSGELGPPPPRPWDYCFVDLDRLPTIRWPGLMELTVDSECRHWVFYDMEPAGICLEPWTGPPNSLNTQERTVVMAERPLAATMRWTWRPIT